MQSGANAQKMMFTPICDGIGRRRLRVSQSKAGFKPGKCSLHRDDLSVPVLWLWVWGNHPPVKDTTTRKSLVGTLAVK